MTPLFLTCLTKLIFLQITSNAAQTTYVGKRRRWRCAIVHCVLLVALSDGEGEKEEKEEDGRMEQLNKVREREREREK